jgi:hypothetical protein
MAKKRTARGLDRPPCHPAANPRNETHAHEVHAREEVHVREAHAHEAQVRVTQLTSADTKPSTASARLNCLALSHLLVPLLEVPRKALAEQQRCKRAEPSVKLIPTPIINVRPLFDCNLL